MKIQHTAGPWVLEAGRTIKTQHGEFCLTYQHDKRGNPSFRPVDGWSELDANARVIAAAPELLAALRALASTARTFRNVPQEDQEWTSIDEDALTVAFAAIAKATGEEVA